MTCRNGPVTYREVLAAIDFYYDIPEELGGPSGDYLRQVQCPADHLVCGINARTLSTSEVWYTDNTGINGLRLYCCGEDTGALATTPVEVADAVGGTWLPAASMCPPWHFVSKATVQLKLHQSSGDNTRTGLTGLWLLWRCPAGKMPSSDRRTCVDGSICMPTLLTVSINIRNLQFAVQIGMVTTFMDMSEFVPPYTAYRMNSSLYSRALDLTALAGGDVDACD